MSRVPARLETGLMFAPYPAARRMRAASPFPSHALSREQVERERRIGPCFRRDDIIWLDFPAGWGVPGVHTSAWKKPGAERVSTAARPCLSGHLGPGPRM